MKVLHVIGSVGVGGAEKHVLDLCLQQQALGLAVHVALPAVGALSATLVQHHIAYTIVRAGSRWHPWALWSLRCAIKDAQPDIIHAHMLKSATMVGRVNRHIPCVATAHNIVKHTSPFVHCQHVICVSEMVRDSLCQLGYPPEKCSVIHNAVETHAFSTAKRDAVRHQMGWQDALIVSCVARLVPAKGQVYAIQALPELVQVIPNLKLVLIGDGGDRHKLEQLADTLNVSQHIEMLGARADVTDLLAATDIYLQPSIKEGFCIAFLEAMATGLACIGTQTGAIPSMVANDSGILIPPADVPAIVDTVLRLTQDLALRKLYAQAAKTTANTVFSPERQAEETVAVYQSLV
ncbi:MAG: glycosyltransferase family 4 protein [Sulfuriferula sp.]|nr:glycosyltransferase family 4 protein [Sulfuriferula sp.]